LYLLDDPRISWGGWMIVARRHPIIGLNIYQILSFPYQALFW